VHHQLPSILIPYPYATQDHQKKNANHLVNASAALCVEEDAASLKKALLKLLSSEYARQSMRQSLAPLSYPRAIEDMMGLIQEEHA
jgi:UDP-N-acetylglucosamine--N-acetylmuramyl-(pentapeptide) pyrophosphoryl-undecaprenol N-acetylglucosamine transferase